MTELELYKFIKDKGLEYHWGNDEVYLFLYIFQLDEFIKLLPSNIFDYFEHGLKITLRQDYLCFEMKDICDYCDIDMEKIFEKEQK